MTTELDPATEGVVRRVWAARMGIPAEVFDRDEVVRAARPGMTAVVVVRLGAATVVAAPEEALSALRGLAPGQLLDTGVLLDVLGAMAPSLLGTASLLVVDRGTFTPAAGDHARVATDPEVEEVLARCSAAERDESGLDQMAARWVIGQAAVAGYEVWGEALAHVGLAVAPRHRGQGLGAVAATAAAVGAMDAGLVPQWRCGVDNPHSWRVAERLGFVAVGEQLAIDVESATISG